MNKLLKGSIAGAAGIALLLGGAGTFALWNQTATVANGSVTSGVLTIAAGATGTWKDISADKVAGGVAIPDISTFKIVPGDKLELTQTVTINATGNNLAAKLTYDPATIATANSNAATQLLNEALKNKLVVTFTAAGTGVTAGTNEATIAPTTAATTVTVKMTIELPSATGTTPTTDAGTIAQNGSVGLAGLAFKLNQTRTV
jgi:alternate signal-mediated exported protein